jgi:hypothetical protein
MKNFKYLFLASAFTFLVSCSTEENDSETSFETENIEVISTTIDDQASNSSLQYGNVVYRNNNDGSVTKTEPGKITYDIISENAKNTSVEVRREKGSDEIKEYVITNQSTKEFVKIFNIREHKGYQTFDMVNNLGITIENVVSKGAIDQLEQRCPPCVVIIVIIAVDALTDSPLEECANSMPSSCPSGQSPYMEFEEGGWFSGDSCSVGCQ